MRLCSCDKCGKTTSVDKSDIEAAWHYFGFYDLCQDCISVVRKAGKELSDKHEKEKKELAMELGLKKELNA